MRTRLDLLCIGDFLGEGLRNDILGLSACVAGTGIGMGIDVLGLLACADSRDELKFLDLVDFGIRVVVVTGTGVLDVEMAVTRNGTLNGGLFKDEDRDRDVLGRGLMRRFGI